MAVRVLVVDDSGFLRRRLTEILNDDRHIEVVGGASNGAEAIRKAAELKPDVITMDVEMPVMDGITAVRQIMSQQPTPILMVSSLTTDGAQATLDALDAGAMDFLPKNIEDIASDRNEALRILRARVRLIGARGLSKDVGGAPTGSSRRSNVRAALTAASAVPRIRRGNYSVVAIGTSTGGPVALQKVLSALPVDFRIPLVLIQHMPASFTPAFAQRLDKLCAITVKEAQDGECLRAGTAFLAPGGKQLIVERRGAQSVLRVLESEPAQHYRPCVDVTFTSIAEAFPGSVLAVVLTGMGADGREGARLLKAGGSTVWAQDEESCVVYGMPAAVVQAELADQILPLTDVGSCLVQSV